MAATGRYRDVSRSSTPGDLPAEGQGAYPPGAMRIGPGLTASSSRARAEQQASRAEQRRTQAHSRPAGAAAFVKHGVVDDPNPSLRGRRQRAAINIKTDALESEYARGRISEAGYWAGRTYKAVLERSRRPLSGGGAWNPGNRVDQVISHEIAILERIANADDAVGMLNETSRVLGILGQRILELVLVDELTITAAAKRIRGRDDRQTVIYWSQRFRESCELLAEHWRGPRHRAPSVGRKPVAAAEPTAKAPRHGRPL